jgi:hypothetical protein
MQIEVSSFREIQEGKKTFIVFHIDICYKEWRNIVEKRYSEFYQLHEVMTLIHKIVRGDLPDLPSQMTLKSLFKKLTKDDLEQRKRDLQSYLRALEKTPCAKHSKSFPEFIGLPLRYREDWTTGMNS